MAETLSEEEFKKLQEAGELEEVSDEPETLSEEEFSKLQEAGELEEVGAEREEFSEGGSAAMGGIQGVTLGFADEIAGGMRALHETVTGDATFSEWNTTYTKHRDEVRQSFKDAEVSNPKSFLAGEMAGGVGSLLIPAGIPAKLGAAGMKAVLAGNTIKAAALAGGISGVGMAEEIGTDMTAEDLATIGMSTAGAAAGGAIGKGIGSAFKKITAKKTAQMVQKVAAEKHKTIREAVGMDKASNVTKYKKMMVQLDTNPDEVAAVYDRAVPWKEGMNPDQVVENFVKRKQKVWDDIEKIHQTIDGKNKDGVINTQALLADLQDELGQELSGLPPETIDQHISKITRSLTGYADDPKLTMGKMQEIKNAVGSRYKADNSSESHVARRAIYRVLRRNMNNAAEQVADPEVKKSLQIANKEYGILAETMGITDQVDSTFIAAVNRHGASTVKAAEAAAGLAQVWVGSKLFSPQIMVGGVARAFRGIVAGQPASRRAASLARLADKIEAAPGRFSQDVTNILAAAGRSVDEFADEMSVLEGKVNLSESPVKRTTQDAYLRATDILPLLKKESPGVAQALTQAMANGDDGQVAQIMSNLGRLYPQFIEPGIGMDGKAVTDVDRQEAIQFLESTDWGTTQKMIARDNLNNFSLLPDWNEPRQTPFEPVRGAKERDKSGKKRNDY
jgi:hypothetical protein